VTHSAEVPYLEGIMTRSVSDTDAPLGQLTSAVQSLTHFALTAEPPREEDSSVLGLPGSSAQSRSESSR
jgi:hypothetical protein